MFGIRHVSFDAMTYVIHYSRGRIKKEGKGLSFYYFAPTSSIMAIPLGSGDIPFIFKENTNDYQTISVQGQISYKIQNPKMLADVLDFTVTRDLKYKKNDIEKLNQRIVNEAQTSIASFVHEIKLREAIRSAKEIEIKILEGLRNASAITLLGVEILSASILSVQASPEMSRALETETREKLQQEADQAVYERRNFAVEQERKIAESELNTEIALEEKTKHVEQKKTETQIQKAEGDRQLGQLKLEADIYIKSKELESQITLETQRKNLIEQKTVNDKKEADSKGYIIETTLKPYKNIDWKIIAALQNSSDPRFNIALAFRELAENAGKIGNINITPELLDSLLKNK